MRALIIHEWLTTNAGSERVVAAFRELLPGAPVATTMCWGEAFSDWHVITTPLQRFANGPESHIRCLPLMPFAWRSLRLPPADLVVTSFHTFALWARVPDDVEHWVYCHTPPRYLWEQHQLAQRGSLGLSLTTRAIGRVGRYIDRRRAIGQPVKWIANSAYTAERLQRAYGVTAEVVHPPVDTEPFRKASLSTPKGDYYLIFGRVVPHKRVDLAIEAFRDLGLPLVVGGSGRGLERLQRIAPPNVTFLGWVPEGERPGLLAGARALLLPGEEDFGIVPMEARAAGTSVIGYRQGGLIETIGNDPNSSLFHPQTPEALAAAVRALESRLNR